MPPQQPQLPVGNDLDALLGSVAPQGQQGGTLPTGDDLDNLMASVGAKTQPAQGSLGLNKATGVKPGQSESADFADSVLGYVTDPTKVLPDVGQWLGGLYGGMPGGAGGRVAGDIVGQAIHQGSPTPNLDLMSELGQAATGGFGEGLGKLLSIPARGISKAVGLPTEFGTPMTPAGATTQRILGDQAMIPNLVDSTPWNFAANVSREGYLSKGAMTKAETAQGQTLLGKMTGQAEQELPTPPAQGGQLNPTIALAGQEAQDQLRNQYITKKAEGMALYKDFLKDHGNDVVREAFDGEGKAASEPITLNQMHQAQSDALEQARAAAGANDSKGQMEAMKRAHNIRDEMKANLDPDVYKQYSDISDQYGKIMTQYDNPVVRHLREGVPMEQLLDNVLDANKLKTFPPFRDITTVAGRNMPTHQMVSQEDAIHLVRSALGEEKFDQFRADSIFHLGQENIKTLPNGAQVLDGASTVKALEKLPPNVQAALFGPGRAKNINDIAQTAKNVQGGRTGSGGLWIVMRQPSAALAAGATVYGAAAATGNRNDAPGIALATSGTIILAPWVFSKILLSPGATKLFVQATKAATPDIKETLLKGLSAVVARTTATGISSKTRSTLIPSPPSMTTPGTIPSLAPPQQR